MRIGRSALAGLAALLACGPAAAHDGYPVDCCGGRDCRPVLCEQLQEIADGRVRDLGTGTVFEAHQVRPTFDGRCHVCTISGAKFGPPLCVFTQRFGF